MAHVSRWLAAEGLDAMGLTAAGGGGVSGGAQAENARLLRLLELTPKQAAPPGPVQTGFFEAPPGPVDRQSPPEAKVDFFGTLFTARTDLYAVRWENTRAGKAGWLPAVRGGWRKGMRHEDRTYLPLTREVLRSHLSGETHIGLYPLLDGDLCSWLAADFDGQAALLDGLAYLKPPGLGRSRQRWKCHSRGSAHTRGSSSPHPYRRKPAARHRTAAGGDGRTRAHGPGQL
jgi:hypothetical protein